MRKPISTRRSFLAAATSTLAVGHGIAAGSTVSLQIGVTDWNLNLGAKPEAVSKAAQLGFKGVQVSFGRLLSGGKLPVDNPETIGQYLKSSEQLGVAIDGTCVDRLHDNGLKSDPMALRWVSDAIRLTQNLKTKILLLPFFGRWALKTDAEMAYVGDALRELAPQAERAGIMLGLEDTISAEDNVRIMEMSRSSNVSVYYDVGNSTVAGFDVVKEIRWLGKDRICQFHFKDNPHLLGEGTIPFRQVVQAIRDIGWSGWANLETDARPGLLDSDMRQNLSYIRHIIDEVYG
ncbi:MAG TPA: sugar phosphate isomerase/epimerase family protein [Bryobacteraceae bacterium]|nr:sugar phosphate isomerase/epimerase family protein [Bryobacteraceae bacterium]